jgi:predicted aspartyl protease
MAGVLPPRIACATVLLALACTPSGPSLFPDRIDLTIAHEVGFEVRDVPIVEASIDGKGPYQLVFDTGAEMLVLDISVAKELGLPRARYNANTIGRSVGGWAPSYFARVDSIRIGSLERTGLDAMVTDLRSNVRVDGLLGLPVFYDLVTAVDYGRRVLRFTSGPSLDPDAPGVLRIDQRYGISLSVTARFEGRTFLARLDTGASGALYAEPSFLEALQEPPWLVPYARTPSPTGSAPTRVGRIPGDLSLGGHVFRDPIAIAPERPIVLGPSARYTVDPPLTLGHAFLRQFELVIDRRSGLVRLTREGSGPITSPPLRDVALSAPTRWQDGALVVVEPGPSMGDALHVGDRIVTIGGHPASEYSPAMLDGYAEGETVEIGVERGQEQLRVDVPVITLVE